MPKSELIDLTVEKLHETSKAWLVTDGDKKEWFAKSLCELVETGPNKWELTAPLWLAKEKGFI